MGSGWEKAPGYGGRDPGPLGWVTIVALLALLTFAVFSCQSAQGQQALVGQASVVDGDTIEIHGQRVRLWGIDAPESAQQCMTAQGVSEPIGRRAANRLDVIVGDHVVTCVDRGRDRYGRIIGACEASGADISRRMVQEGLAWAYVQYSSDYVVVETAARNDREGVWSMTCETPWDWRRQRRAR